MALVRDTSTGVDYGVRPRTPTANATYTGATAADDPTRNYGESGQTWLQRLYDTDRERFDTRYNQSPSLQSQWEVKDGQVVENPRNFFVRNAWMLPVMAATGGVGLGLAGAFGGAAAAGSGAATAASSAAPFAGTGLSSAGLSSALTGTALVPSALAPTSGGLLASLGGIGGAAKLGLTGASLLSKAFRSGDGPSSGSTAVSRGSGGGVNPSVLNYDAMRARALAPVRSVYMNAQRNLSRQRALQGGYAPGYGAQQLALSRGLSNDLSDTAINTEAEIGKMRLAELGMNRDYETRNRQLDIQEKQGPSSVSRTVGDINSILGLIGTGADIYSGFID